MTRPAVPAGATPPEVLQQLATAWLGTFQGVARIQDMEALKALFHEKAVLWGIEKGGCCDWPLRLQFEFALANALIVPLAPFVMVLCDWSMQPLVVGGDVKRGHATFLLAVVPAEEKHKGKVECVHAHFSAAVNPP